MNKEAASPDGGRVVTSTSIEVTTTRSLKRQQRRRTRDRSVGVIALVLIAVAWVVGGWVTGVDLEPHLATVWPTADRFQPAPGNGYMALAGDELLGYVYSSEAVGYGGPITLAVAVDVAGLIVSVEIIDHKETPSYFERVAGSGFLGDLLGLGYESEAGDVDVVTGATYTSAALAEAALGASRDVAGGPLELAVPTEESPSVVIGVAEVLLVGLYGIGWIGHRKRFLRYRSKIRWATLLIGLFGIGFWLNAPLTLSRVTSVLAGYWPAWQTNLYWYMLIGGILFIFTVDNKNAYCAWFCPFGAAQDVMGAIGGSRHRVPIAARRKLVWVQRGLAWAAIVIALLLRNPGLTSYEVFGTLFALTGSALLFLLLGLVLLTSLFVKRPWCHFLCPLDPVFHFIRLVRTWILEQWRKTKGPQPESAR